MEHVTIDSPARRGTEEESGSSGVQERAQQAAGQAQEKAQEAGAVARERIRSQLDERTTQAGERVDGAASDMRSVAEELRRQGKEQPAQAVEQVAQRVERIGGYLRSSDAERMLHDLEGLGRRKPWAIALGGAALGLAASRFLKASSTQRYQALGGASPSQSGPERPRGVETVPRLPQTPRESAYMDGR
jgi:hypothetical protein